MALTPKSRIERFCTKNRLDHEWQMLKFGFERAVVPVGDRRQLSLVLEMAEALKGVAVSYWECGIGTFSGYVYLMAQEDDAELKRLLDEGVSQSWDWWNRYRVADEEVRSLMACGAIE